MKFSGLSYLYLLAAIVALSACNGNKSDGNKEQQSIYYSPQLKGITEKIEKEPQNARLYYDRGKLLHKLQQDSLAITDFKQAVKLDSTKAEYHSAIGNILFDHKDITGSVHWLQQAIALNPTDPQAHLKVAKMFLFLKEYPKAFNEVNIVLRQDAFNPEGYFLKGIIYRDMKDTARALSSLATAVNVAPDYREAVLQLGVLNAAKNNPIALKYYDNAFRLDTLDEQPLYNRGMYYQKQENYEKAKAEYNNTIMHDKQYAPAFFSMGWILLQQDSVEKAWRQFDLVTKMEPNNADAYYNRALCSELMGNKQDAINDYKQALTFNDRYTEATDALKRLGVTAK